MIRFGPAAQSSSEWMARHKPLAWAGRSPLPEAAWVNTRYGVRFVIPFHTSLTSVSTAA